MDLYITLCTVHTTEGQGQKQETIVSIVLVPVPAPVPVLVPCIVYEPLMSPILTADSTGSGDRAVETKEQRTLKKEQGTLLPYPLIHH